MPCACISNLCNTCACGKKGHLCDAACHGGAGMSGNSICLNTIEGQKVAALGVPEVRKTLAGLGLDVIGNGNELKRRLADYLLSQATTSVAASENASSAAPATAAGQPQRATALIKSAIECGDNYADLLSLGGTPVSASTPASELRRAYLKLSLVLHPDKNGNSAESKQAFQALVLAFERLSQPTDEGDSGDRSAKSRPRERVDTSVQRSNAGCVQTRIYCPRCRMDWPRKELGLEEAAYNFFMSALKEYTCGRCMCLFGCMSAIHECPACKKPFSYSPSDYHRQIVCGNPGCARTFGFIQYPVSARRLAEVKKELSAAQEARMRRADAASRRQGRARARVDESSSSSGGSSSSSDPEALFRLELVDECPRCGASAADLEEDGISPAEHLAGCRDKKAHAAHASAQRALAMKREAEAARTASAEDAAALARWEAMGRVVSNLWSLPVGALRELCRKSGLFSIDPRGSKVELIRAIRVASTQRADTKMLMDASSSSSRGGSSSASAGARMDMAGIADLDTHELPSNLHSLDAEQLACVCAACGVPGDESDGKAALIRILEGARFAGREEEAGLLTGSRKFLEDGGGKKRSAARLLMDKSGGDSSAEDEDADFDFDEEDDEDDRPAKRKKKSRK